MTFRYLFSPSPRSLALGILIVGIALFAAKDGAAAKKERDKQTPVAKIRKEQLRYAGKSFEQWREQLLTELMPKVRIESLKVLIVFAHHGYAAETTAALLELGRGYETWLELEERENEGAFESKSFLSNDEEAGEGAVYETAASAVVTIGPAAVPILRSGLKEESRAVRFFALYAMGKMKGYAKEAVPDLVEITQGRDLELRRCALDILGKVGAKDKRVLPPLRAALKDKEKRVRCTALDAIIELGPDIGGPASADILETLKDRESEVREKALEALKKTGLSAKAVPPLLKAIQDADAEVQHQAYLCLQQLGPQGKEAVPALIANLKRLPSGDDKKQDRRIRGGRMTIGDPSVEAYLLERFDELSHVIETLGAIGPDAKEAIPVLKKMLDKVNQTQKEKITEALKKIAGEKPASLYPTPTNAKSPF